MRCADLQVRIFGNYGTGVMNTCFGTLICSIVCFMIIRFGFIAAVVGFALGFTSNLLVKFVVGNGKARRSVVQYTDI